MIDHLLVYDIDGNLDGAKPLFRSISIGCRHRNLVGHLDVTKRLYVFESVAELIKTILIRLPFLK